MRRPGGKAVATAAALAVWAAALWFLDLSGRWALLLSTRTRWVLPVGAVILSAGAVARLAAAMRGPSRGLRAREAAQLAVMVLPALIVLILPPATLGAAATTNRGTFGGTAVTASDEGGPPTLVQVAAAHYSQNALQRLARDAGVRVTYVGFVHRDADTPADQFLLTRFVVTCCVADALVAQVRVVGLEEQGVRDNQWVQVTGRLYPVRDDILLLADHVKVVPKPAHPYVTP